MLFNIFFKIGDQISIKNGTLRGVNENTRYVTGSVTVNLPATSPLPQVSIQGPSNVGSCDGFSLNGYPKFKITQINKQTNKQTLKQTNIKTNKH